MPDKSIDLPRDASELFSRRKAFSKGRLAGFSSSLKTSDKVNNISGLCIFSAGSYGRLEASEHSDIDLFFISDQPRKDYPEIRVPEIQLFSEVIDAGYKMDFPKFSNDGEFLKLLHLDEIENNLGSRSDDFHNHFTARMLLLPESRPVFGEDVFDKILKSVINSYFRDYSHHPDDFKPTFLVNDIVRFWKTLCLNYEHGRNQSDERQKVKQKIRNFKLKYSRLMTCFATVALLSNYKDAITPERVFEICKMTPAERFLELASINEKVSAKVQESLVSYAWFMNLTEMTKEELEAYFDDKEKRSNAFAQAQKFGDLIFNVMLEINSENKVLRYVVL